MDKGIVFDIKKFSIHDGPGIRTAVFLKGCPLNCWWCHNPESQSPKLERIYREARCVRCGVCVDTCRHGAIYRDGDAIGTDEEKCVLCGECAEACYAQAREIIGKAMTVAQVISTIEQDVVFYDQSGGGATFTGGEPLMQIAFLSGLLRACKERGIHTAVDTCGFATWETFDRIRDHVDLFLYDLKLMDDGKHRKYTGVSNRIILENLRRLAEEGHAIALRLPVIPGINDDEQNLRATGDFAVSLAHLPHLSLLPYHRAASTKYEYLNRAYALSEFRPPSEARMAEIAQFFEGYGLTVQIGG